jgi:inorganic pyrophosphatase
MKGADRGDGDPLDICVVSERPITRAEVILNARVVGGLPMLDSNEADDKIIAILENDPLWSTVNDLEDLPAPLVERLRHYFLTYKMTLGRPNTVSIGDSYGRAHAERVIQAAMQDYVSEYETAV